MLSSLSMLEHVGRRYYHCITSQFLRHFTTSPLYIEKLTNWPRRWFLHTCRNEGVFAKMTQRNVPGSKYCVISTLIMFEVCGESKLNTTTSHNTTDGQSLMFFYWKEGFSVIIIKRLCIFGRFKKGNPLISTFCRRHNACLHFKQQEVKCSLLHDIKQVLSQVYLLSFKSS